MSPAIRLEKITKTKDSGWSLAMHLLASGDDVLVHSPTFVDERTFAQVAAFGAPRFLFAPNHFHHLSLGRFAAAFPDASIVAGAKSVDRLRRLGYRAARPIDATALRGVRALEAEGTRSGETILAFGPESAREWLVCDAFFAVSGPVTGLEGLALRLTGTVPGLRVGKTFRVLALDDRRVYLRWLERMLDEERPTVLHVAHGETVRDADLASRLRDAARATLG